MGYLKGSSYKLLFGLLDAVADTDKSIALLLSSPLISQTLFEDVLNLFGDDLGLVSSSSTSTIESPFRAFKTIPLEWCTSEKNLNNAQVRAVVDEIRVSSGRRRASPPPPKVASLSAVKLF